MELRGKRATVVGLGIEGLALTRYLVSQGAQVTVNDAKPADQLGDRIAQIGNLPVRLALGGNSAEATAGADIVFVSQGVPLDVPAVAAAQARGVPLSSVTRLFMELCPAPIVGITGSAGKSTTTSLTGAIFRAAFGPARVHVGGNLGPMPLDRITDIHPDHWVVLEISHTQLELTNRSPRAAAITNISPSHMDRYPTMEEYTALKKRIYAFQGTDDCLILNYDDPVTRGMAAEAAGQVLFFSLDDAQRDGAFLREADVMLRLRKQEQVLFPRSRIRLRGEHNVYNVLTACALAASCGIPAAAMAQAVSEFTGIEHRLEPVATVGSVEYINDSIASTPERTIAGLRCFDDRPLVLILGGRDKHLPLESLVAEVGPRCTAVVLYGESGPSLEAALQEVPGLRMVRVGPFAAAVQEAAGMARPGDVVLLSPACTSFDQFPNFEARGREFKRLVHQMMRAEG